MSQRRRVYLIGVVEVTELMGQIYIVLEGIAAVGKDAAGSDRRNRFHHGSMDTIRLIAQRIQLILHHVVQGLIQFRAYLFNIFIQKSKHLFAAHPQRFSHINIADTVSRALHQRRAELINIVQHRLDILGRIVAIELLGVAVLKEIVIAEQPCKFIAVVDQVDINRRDHLFPCLTQKSYDLLPVFFRQLAVRSVGHSLKLTGDRLAHGQMIFRNNGGVLTGQLFHFRRKVHRVKIDMDLLWINDLSERITVRSVQSISDGASSLIL